MEIIWGFIQLDDSAYLDGVYQGGQAQHMLGNPERDGP